MNNKISHLAQITILIPKTQFEELLVLAKESGCKDIVELISKSFELTKLLAEIKRKNMKILAFDRAKTTEVISEESGRTIMICESKDSCLDIVSTLNETFDINSQISETNAWGLPIESFLA